MLSVVWSFFKGFGLSNDGHFQPYQGYSRHAKRRHLHFFLCYLCPSRDRVPRICVTNAKGIIKSEQLKAVLVLVVVRLLRHKIQSTNKYQKQVHYNSSSANTKMSDLHDKLHPFYNGA